MRNHLRRALFTAPAVLILLVAAVFGLGVHPARAASSDATILNSSTIKGQSIAHLGIPKSAVASITGPDEGYVTINSIQAADTTNAGSYVTRFVPTTTGATITKVVKYAQGASDANFATDTAYNGTGAINNQDYFVIEVTAADGSTILYYEIEVSVSVVNLTTITSAGVGVMVPPVAGATPQLAGNLAPVGSGFVVTSLSWSPTTTVFAGLTQYTATITLTSSSGYQFPSGGLLASAINVGLGGSNGTPSAGTTTGVGSGNILTFTDTFPATGALTLSTISSAGAGVIIAPVAGATPQLLSNLAPTTPGYTVTGLFWTPSSTIFQSSQVYTAWIKLTSSAGYEFPAGGLPSSDIDVSLGGSDGTPSAGVTTGTGSGNTLAFTDTFPATGTLVLSSDATILNSSTIKGQSIAHLGIPKSAVASITGPDEGYVTINSIQAADTTNAGSYVTRFVPTTTGATITKVVKYAQGASDANFATDTAYNGTGAINNQDYFVIEVTAADGSTILYYEIEVSVSASVPTPIVNTITPTLNITDTSATLQGDITNTGGVGVFVTARGFNYGTTNLYGSFSLPDTGSYSAGFFTENISNLTCGTTYHYQAFATNSGSTGVGSDGVFTTLPCSSGGGGGGGNGGTTYVCSDPNATNYQQYGISDPQLCVYASTPTPATQSPTVNVLGKPGMCPTAQLITQNLAAPARNGVYARYTQGIVTQANLLQLALNRLNFDSGKVDGILGPISDGAIRRMQTFLGTKADGYVGPITRALINDSCGS